jgi:hypothetical protein
VSQFELSIVVASIIIEIAISEILATCGEPWVGPENGVRVLAVAPVLPLARTQSRSVYSVALLSCLFLFVVFAVIGTAE